MTFVHDAAAHPLTEAELRQMILAAQLYYEADNTQDEIARCLGWSRPKVSRVLREARQRGIVRITIVDPLTGETGLANEVATTLGLGEAIVVPGELADADLNRQRVGHAAARWLLGRLPARGNVGLGWGRTLREVVLALVGATRVQRVPPRPSLTVLPLLGGLGQIAPSFQVHELSRQLAEALGLKWRQLWAPAIVEDIDVRARLLETPEVRVVVEEWDRLDVAIVGIGNVDADHEMWNLFTDYLDDEHRARLREMGAVGEICMRYFDHDGRPIPDALPGAVSAGLEQLRRTQVVAAACGAHKVDAILAAVRGGYVRVLVTDEGTARALLARVREA